MTRTDPLVVGTLVVLLAIVAGLIGVPALSPAATTTAQPSQSPAVDASTRPYREGVLGHPVSVSPLTARTQADRDLVALVFSGLVRNGPTGRSCPTSPSAGRSTRPARVDLPAARRRGLARRRAGDRGGRRLHDPDPPGPGLHGPAAGSWNEVTVQATAPRTVTFTLKTPLGGFLQAATQPIAPAHLLADVPIADLPDHPFGRQPIGSGPFAIASLTDDAAELIPAATLHLDGASGAGATPRSTDSLATAPPLGRPTRPVPYLAGIEFRFFDDPKALADAYRSGSLDAASGLAPALAAELGSTDGSRLLRYPGATLTAVLLNLRPGHPEFAKPAVRTALLAAIDRVGSSPTRSRWGPPRPPARSRRRRRCSIRRPTRPSRTTRTRPGRRSRRPAGRRWPTAGTSRGEGTVAIELLSPDRGVEPGRCTGGRGVAPRLDDARDSSVTHVRAAARRVRDGRVWRPATSRSRSPTSRSASTPTSTRCSPRARPLTGGSNVIGLQDPTLDKLLVAARAPGHAMPSGRPPTRRSRSSSRRAATCSRWPSRTRSSWSATRSRDPSMRQVADPVGSILGCANMAPRRRPVDGRARSAPRWRNRQTR